MLGEISIQSVSENQVVFGIVHFRLRFLDANARQSAGAHKIRYATEILLSQFNSVVRSIRFSGLRGSSYKENQGAKGQQKHWRLSHWNSQCTIRVGERLTIPQQHATPIDSVAPPLATPAWLTAVRAAESKKAADIRVLDLRGVTSFADFFVICTGNNSKQVQAIVEEIGQQLETRGEYPVSVEGFANAEWVLADYGDYLIHVFSPKARAFYELERLWRHAKAVEFTEDESQLAHAAGSEPEA